MERLVRFFKRTKVSVPTPSEQSTQIFFPILTPNQRRRQSFLYVPGVINGTVNLDTPDGIWKIDFDHRRDIFYPTTTFHPKNNLPITNTY